MKKRFSFRRALSLAFVLLLALAVLCGCADKNISSLQNEQSAPDTRGSFVEKGQSYQDKEHVAAYLRAFSALPPNYITKKEAQALGWVASEGNLWSVAPGKSIGGDRFGNYEKLLPEKSGRTWKECDIDFDGAFRNGKRIVFSSDGLIYYTDDHYKTFTEIKNDE